MMTTTKQFTLNDRCIRIGDRFTLKGRKTVYIYEGFDDLDGYFVAAKAGGSRDIRYFDGTETIVKL